MTPDRVRTDRTVSHLKLSSDEDLMEACVADSEAAFQELTNRYKNRILNIITRYIGDRHRAEDLTQETFMRVFLHRHRYRRSGKFSTWIYTIGVNLAKNEIRKKVRLRRVVSLEASAEKETGAPLQIPDGSPVADEQVISRDMSRMVQEAILRLPAKYREVLILRDIQDLSYIEIGEVLGLPGGTVRSRINRARLALKEKLAPHMKRSGYEL